MFSPENIAAWAAVAAVLVALGSAFLSYLAYHYQVDFARKAQDATDEQIKFSIKSAEESSRETKEALELTRKSVDAQHKLADAFKRNAEYTETLARKAGETLDHARSMAQISHRPYLEFEILRHSVSETLAYRSMVPQKDLKSRENYHRIVLLIKNNGNTPAINISGKYFIGKSGYATFDTFIEEKTNSITPINSLSDSSKQELSIEEFDKYSHLIVKGEIEYKDTFDKFHQENFCFRVTLDDVEVCPPEALGMKDNDS